MHIPFAQSESGKLYEFPAVTKVVGVAPTLRGVGVAGFLGVRRGLVSFHPPLSRPWPPESAFRHHLPRARGLTFSPSGLGIPSDTTSFAWPTLLAVQLDLGILASIGIFGFCGLLLFDIASRLSSLENQKEGGRSF